MSKPNQLQKEHNELNEIPKEAMHLIELLDQIEVHTAELRKKLMEEIKKANALKVSLKLDEVE